MQCFGARWRAYTHQVSAPFWGFFWILGRSVPAFEACTEKAASLVPENSAIPVLRAFGMAFAKQEQFC
jgi:hypothetical protein